MMKLFTPKAPPSFELLDLQNLCRICLQTKSNLKSIFIEEIDSLLLEFLPNVSKIPSYPQQICENCLSEAKSAYIFKTQCKFADSLIKSALNYHNEIDDHKKKLDKETQTQKENNHECKMCQKCFSRSDHLKRHIKTIHLKNLNKPNNINFEGNFDLHEKQNKNECKLCKKIFSRKYHLQRHLSNVHLKKSSKSSDLENEIISDFHEENSNYDDSYCLENEDADKKLRYDDIEIAKFEFTCQQCNKGFVSESELNSHTCIHGEHESSSQMNQFTQQIAVPNLRFESNKEESRENYSSYLSERNIKPNFEYKNSDSGASINENIFCEDEKPNEVLFRENIADSVNLQEMLLTSKENVIEEKHRKILPNSSGKFECTVCNKTFTRGNHLRRHQRIHSSNPKPFSCTSCTKSFTRSDHLRYHINGVHAEVRPFKCEKCGKAFTRNEHLKRHLTICPTDKRKISPKEKKFPCEICQKKFVSMKHVEDHKMMQHNETKEFTCKYCSQILIGSTEYKNHCKSHYTTNAKQFLCSECGANFTRYQYLLVHLRRHTGEKPYKCRFCDKAFPRTTDQYAHERSHTGEKNHHCTNCNKSFSTAYRLRVHMRVHTGERPYKCLYCPKAFAQNNDLKAHHRRHTGERFDCNICSQGFVQMYALRQHKRQAHGIEEPKTTNYLILRNDSENQINKQEILYNREQEENLINPNC